METGVLLVWSSPVSDDESAAYDSWYEQRHLPDVVSLPGFVSAERFEVVDHARCAESATRRLAVYRISAPDLNEALGVLLEASTAGRLPLSSALQMDPPPTLQLWRSVAEFPAG
jgi:hypothetical protein